MNSSTDAQVAAAPWTDLLEALAGFSDTTFLGSIQEDLVVSAPGHLSTGSELHNLNAVNDTAFTPALTPSMGAYTNLTNQTNYNFSNVPDHWSMQDPHTSHSWFSHDPSCSADSKGFVDTRIVAPELLDDTRAPFAAAVPNQAVDPSSSATSLAFRDELSWLFEAGLLTPATSSSPTSSGNEMGPVAPEYGTSFYGATISPTEWNIGQVFWPTPEAPATSAPVLALGKRRREESPDVVALIDDQRMPPQKRGRGGQTKGILEATQSADRTRHKTVTRIPNRIDCEPKEAGRGAERLATPNTQGIHHRPLQGPSSQQGRVEQTADAEPIWGEGSVEEGLVQQGPVQQQQQEQQQQDGAEQEYLKFPNKLEMECVALLAATQADRERCSVREIRCRRCPSDTFKTWGAYKRHCKTKEKHPLEIDYCDDCGDFFARTDALNRHREHPPPECLSVTRERADEKRRETQRVHDEFIARLREFLRTGEEYVEVPFSKAIKEKYPESSKKNKPDEN